MGKFRVWWGREISVFPTQVCYEHKNAPNTKSSDFLGSAVVKTLPSNAEVQVRSLVRKLRSRIPHGTTKRKTISIKSILKKSYTCIPNFLLNKSPSFLSLISQTLRPCSTKLCEEWWGKETSKGILKPIPSSLWRAGLLQVNKHLLK